MISTKQLNKIEKQRERKRKLKKQVAQGKQSARKQYKKKNNKKHEFQFQYKRQEWIELRNRIIRRDHNRCVACHCESNVFHVHHLLYHKDKSIWDVPDFYLVTLCPDCHIKEHSKQFIPPSKHY